MNIKTTILWLLCGIVSLSLTFKFGNGREITYASAALIVLSGPILFPFQAIVALTTIKTPCLLNCKAGDN